MMKKISIIILLIISVIIAMPQKSEAGFDMKTIMDGGNSFLDNSEDREIFNAGNERAAVDQIYFMMLTIGIVIAVFVGSVLGIQFITSGAEGQAKVKEKIIPFVLGAFVVFGAFGIWRITYNILNGFF